MGIGETLRQALAKLVMRAAGDQAKTACGNLQLCAGLKAGIEGATHTVGQRRVERVHTRRGEGEHEVEEATVDLDDEGNEEVSDLGINNFLNRDGGQQRGGRGRIGGGSRDRSWGG